MDHAEKQICFSCTWKTHDNSEGAPRMLHRRYLVQHKDSVEGSRNTYTPVILLLHEDEFLFIHSFAALKALVFSLY